MSVHCISWSARAVRPQPCVHTQQFRMHRWHVLRPVAAQTSEAVTTTTYPATQAASEKYGWQLEAAAPAPKAAPAPVMDAKRRLIKDLPVTVIRRPLGRTRANDQAKVEALMASITEIGLQEPIDVLEVDGQYYGFSGCHRFEAHQRLGLEMIRCRVRKATKEVLKMHMA